MELEMAFFGYTIIQGMVENNNCYKNGEENQ